MKSGQALRRAVVRIGHWVMSRRYDVHKVGFGTFDSGASAYLVLPNHVAMVDPMLLFAEFLEQPVSPLCDELYFANPVAAFFLRVFDAVKVPDLRRRRRVADVKAVMGLQDVVLNALGSGKNVLFYPSGHIATGPREEIGTRQLAHNVCQRLPEDVRVIGVRTKGLWGSIWSRAGRTTTPSFGPTLLKSIGLWLVCLVTRRRRSVEMAFEDLTDQVKDWTALPRVEFNRKLEDWYNVDCIKGTHDKEMSFASPEDASKDGVKASNAYAGPGWYRAVPEPTSGLMLLFGVAGLALCRRRGS